MLKAYDIQTSYNYSQKTCVVAESIADAERLFLKEYPNTEILEIKLHAVYVIVQKTGLAGEL